MNDKSIASFEREFFYLHELSVSHIYQFFKKSKKNPGGAGNYVLAISLLWKVLFKTGCPDVVEVSRMGLPTINVDLSINSSMALFGLIGVLSYIGGTVIQSLGIQAGSQISSFGLTIFGICFMVIFAFAMVSLARNVGSM
jgi:hypothetical protein